MEESNEMDLESCEVYDVQQQDLRMSDVEGHEDGDVTGGGEDEECELPDEDKEVKELDAPVGFIRVRPSKFKMIPSTVFVEYPKELGMVRGDESVLEPCQDKELHYRCQWARNCIKNAFTRAGFTESAVNWTVTWAQHQTPLKLRELNCLQKVNHFPGSWALGRKDRLSRTMWAMKRLHPTEFNFHPETFVLPADNRCLERCAKTDMFYNKGSNCKSKRLWIVKPVASSCGRGIKVISAERAHSLSKNNERKLLVQRYLGDPYLINKKKFDMRLYVLVTGVDPLRIYLHDEGLIRIATENYSLKNLKSQFVHLTNYSVNKKSKHFCASSMFDFSNNDTEGEVSSASQNGRDGFKWTLKAFKTWLAEKESIDVMEQTMAEVESLIVKTILAAESDLSHSLHSTVNYRTNCFELFGFDVLLDSNLTPHLIEVNVSPSLAGSSPLDAHIKGVLVADVCHVTGFHAHEETLLRKYSTNPSQTNKPALELNADKGVPCDDKDEGNPFSFASLSKLMCGQEEWRKNMTMRNINMSKLINDDAAWYMLLMAEDEFDRAKESKFQKLHPSRGSIKKYISLYKNARFSDQLLGKWILGGLSKGKENRAFLPNRFKNLVEQAESTSQVESLSKQRDMSITMSPRGTGVALARARGRLSSPVGLATNRPVTLTIPHFRAKSADGNRSTPEPTATVHIQYNSGKEISRRTIIESNKMQYYNLRNNLKQQNSFLYDPVQRKNKVYIPHKVNRNIHTSVVFDPCNTDTRQHCEKNSNMLGDIYKGLLQRNMQASRSNSASTLSFLGGPRIQGASFFDSHSNTYKR